MTVTIRCLSFIVLKVTHLDKPPKISYRQQTLHSVYLTYPLSLVPPRSKNGLERITERLRAWFNADFRLWE